jgi:hypothetical protein
VPIQNLHGTGEFRKNITVTTNAKNNPNFKLSIGGNYHPLVEFDPANNWRLTSEKGKDTGGGTITIKTMKKDLKITEVVFKESGKELDWKANVPITFTLAQSDSVKPKKDTASSKVKKTPAGAKPKQEAPLEPQLLYKLKLTYVPISKTDLYGEFTLKSNLKEAEMKISGALEAKKE